MKLPHNAHVAIVDGERFVVMQNTGKPFEPKLENGRTPELEPTNYSAGIRHQDDIGRMKGTSTQMDELAHGAAAAEWLNQRAISGEISDLLIIADPKTLGEMRHHYHSELERKLVGEIPKTLTSEPTPRIEEAIASA